MLTDFQPIAALVEAHEATADRIGQVAVVRPNGCKHIKLYLHSDPAMEQADAFYTDRLVKTALWMQGGFRLVTDDRAVYRHLREAYAPEGTRAFDRSIMAGIYGEPFTVEYASRLPEEFETPAKLSSSANGCRIGIDLGGSDRKAAAVQDGKTVYTEETVWEPKKHRELAYHQREIAEALRAASKHLPRVDAVGFSTAGVVIGDEVRRSSLFMQVSDGDMERGGYNLLRRTVQETLGQIPVAVCNDGDVTALAGSVALGRHNLLGIAMGTSEAGGFIDGDGQITGWLNELAFVPVDSSGAAPVDPWSGDRGVGERYFSQEGVLRLAALQGLCPEGETPAEKLLWVQKETNRGDPRACGIFAELGRMLGMTMPWYRRLTGCESVLLLGRVISGRGGELLVKACRETLQQMGQRVEILLPDETFRRLGQAAAAALLPNIK